MGNGELNILPPDRADCGFGAFASYEFVAPDVAWAKLGSLTEGAAIASKRIWG